MPKELLLSKWNVSENLESLQTLKLARSFLGEIFDAWLSGFLITHTQKQLLIKILEKQGLPIKRLRNLTLQHLRAIADEEDLPHFDISIPAGDRRSILAVELVRLGANSLLVELLEKIAEEDNCLGNPVWEFVGTPSIRPEFEEFVIQQALQCLHGQNYSVDWKDQPLTAYFKDIPSNKPTENVIIGRSDNEEFLL
jgi:hypothetical protein